MTPKPLTTVVRLERPNATEIEAVFAQYAVVSQHALIKIDDNAMATIIFLIA